MSRTRMTILIGMAGGALWAVAVLIIGAQIPVPIGFIQPVLMGALFAPGVVLALMIARLAMRRFMDPDVVDGDMFLPGTGGDLDQRVLQNTLEQIALALCIWPLVGFFLGAGTVLALGLGFALARLAFWAGYHLSPSLRSFGFAATFYPTVAAAVLVVYRLMAG